MITSLSEKKGIQRHIDKVSISFKRFIDDANLIDMDITNDYFTWSNKHGGQHQVASRLDKFSISEEG